ncbi:MAG TPA: ATP-binding protein [Bryobacteraceae bacterium]|nr:ATP-binding protein [Bryobacteraceae bacterium]
MTSFETIGEPGRLGAVTDFVRQAARRAGFDEEDLLTVDLIVEEIFLNIAMHGYQGKQPGLVAIHCDSSRRGELTIQSQDCADAFNPLNGENQALDVPLSERREGGLGLVLVKNIAESISYRWVEGRNELTVRMVSRHLDRAAGE